MATFVYSTSSLAVPVSSAAPLKLQPPFSAEPASDYPLDVPDLDFDGRQNQCFVRSGFTANLSVGATFSISLYSIDLEATNCT